jgi:precorrin-6A/cobalt-precorrin-6A reductase
MDHTSMRILVLGGTTEASACARRLASDERFNATLSLAGRTKAPELPSGIAVRVGGFGGAEGLATWLTKSKTDAIVDATHPFAAQISANAHAAATKLGIPLCTVSRPPWQAESDDRWLSVATTDAAVEALGTDRRRVFLSIGRQGLAAFARAPQHAYMARLIEMPDAGIAIPDLTLVQARGPFALDDEIALLKSERIDVLVSKNAGGRATYPKIEAARRLGIPVVMIERPAKAAGHVARSADEAMHWLERLHAKSRSDRGV